MVKIKIPQNCTPNKINKLFRDYIHKRSGDVIKLILPKKISTYRFGILSDLLLFVITLNKENPIAVLQFEIDNIDELNSLYKQEYTYPIVSLLWNTAIFLNKNEQNIKDELKICQNDYFKKMNSLSDLRGNKCLLSHTDHFSKNNGLVKFLENDKGFNEDEKFITSILKKILQENILTFNKNNKEEINDILNDIGAIIYELAKNTYEWGKTDKTLRPISPSIRGIYIRFHNNYYNKIIEDYIGTPIESFLKSNYIIDNCIQVLDKFYYIEILVYDSGVGFIEKFNNPSNLSDIEIIKKCLIKNQTSSTTVFRSKKGLGLDRILNILNNKGFVKIMTDKYTVFRNLVKDNYIQVGGNEIEQFKLEDWNGNNFKSSSTIKAQGSYISILYPFKKAMF